MSPDIPEDELTEDVVPEWLPNKRLSLDYAPLLYDQSNERVKINIGTLVSDKQGDWIATLYVTDIADRVIYVVGWNPEKEFWASIGI